MNKEHMDQSPVPAPQGIKSLENAFAILDCFKQANEPLTVTNLSNRMNMSKSMVHKYLVSFVRLGVLVQNKNDSTYALGSKLIELGLFALQKYDIVSIAEPYLKKLRDQLNLTIALAVWGNEGPMAVKYEESQGPININVQIGVPIPILMSAAGKCFAAFLPSSIVQPVIDKEIKQYGLKEHEILKELNDIKEHHIARRDTEFIGIPGSKAIASPIFDYSNNIIAAISVVGFPGQLDAENDSEQVTLLKETTKKLSNL